jgi:hypothetical protein
MLPDFPDCTVTCESCGVCVKSPAGWVTLTLATLLVDGA